MNKEQVIAWAREAGFEQLGPDIEDWVCFTDEIERFAALVAAAERKECAKVCEEFARKWWSIHCDSNLHYSSTLKAHQDFCALQAAIKARGKTK